MVYCSQFFSGGLTMDAFFAKLKNFWYYYKIPVLIALAAAAAAAYLGLQKAAAPKADYHIGLVTVTPRSEAQLDMLTDGFAVRGQDLNGDGQVLVQLHTYFVDLADEDPNAGVNNAQTVAGLDADLIGNVSGIFLTEDPQTLQAVTDGLFEEPFCEYADGLYLCLRKNAEDVYKNILP